MPRSSISLGRKLKLSQLMVFTKVLESGSFVRAANDLGLTQPAISKSIFELESLFEEKLFERSNRGTVPTEFAVMLGKRVHSLLAELRFLGEEVDAFQNAETGHVIVGTLISASSELLPRAVAKLRAEAPGILVTIREGTVPYLYPMLITGELDIIVGRLPERDSPFANSSVIRHEMLFEEIFCVVAGPHHPLTRKTGIQMSELAQAEWIFALPDSPARLSSERLFHDAGLPVPSPKVESLSLLANLGLMSRTDLLSFMPRVAAVQLEDMGSVKILDSPMTRGIAKVGYSVRADKELLPSGRRLIDCLYRASSEIEDLLAR